MKKLVSIGMLLASSFAAAGQQVQVTGIGSNAEEAQNDALHKALMRVCKSAVVSDREFRDRATERSKIVIYNGCLVKNYVVDNEESDERFVRMTITAEVIKNNLPDRIINNRDEWFFYDFGKHKDRTNQLRYKRKTTKSFVNEIFIDFPYSAFNLQRSNYYITYQGDRGFLNVTFNVSWNQNYINALNDTFDILQDTESTFMNPARENIRIKRNYVTKTYGFNDAYITDHVHNIMANNRPVIRLRIMDKFGNEQLNVCYQLRHWTNLYDLNTMYYLNILASGSDGDKLSIPIPDNIDDTSELSMDVVTHSFCKDYIF